jgi:hypothetical protein
MKIIFSYIFFDFYYAYTTYHKENQMIPLDPKKAQQLGNEWGKVAADSVFGIADVVNKHNNKKAGNKHISIKKCLSWNIGFRYLGKYIGFKCSSIIFLLHNGYLTKNMFVQHIDHNPFNNKPDNLRECTRSQNTQSNKLRKNNTSGHKGVFLTRDKLKWYVAIKLNGKSHYFGTYQNKEDAIKASIEARKKIHGEFGRIK